MDTPNQDLVSVIISTFNRFDFCVEAVRSALSQTYSNVQVIVVDDCSTDERYLSMERYIRDKRFQHVRLDKSSRTIFGYPSAGYVRNQGII
jgi:glycosyltransferase involved in cell wall biosynthesis